MPLRYYDPALGRARFKRRYKYAALAFAAGLAVGYILGHLL